MSNGVFPRKRLAVIGKVQTQHNSTIDSAFEEIAARVARAKEILAGGHLDAPYYNGAVFLGKISDREQKIFKVNVPGWIYRFAKTTDVYQNTTRNYGMSYSQGKTGILLAANPQYLVADDDQSKQNRIMYMTAWDGGECSNANVMFPILPGQATYMVITHDKTIVADSEQDKEFYFLPTRGAICMNIHPDDYVTVVGSTQNELSLVDVHPTFISNQIVNNIFRTPWNSLDSRGHLNNFGSIYGWMRVMRNQVLFAADDPAKLTSIQANFNKTHPTIQLNNLGEHEFEREGMVAATSTYEPGEHITAVMQADHATQPWSRTDLGMTARSIVPIAEVISGNASKLAASFKQSDGLLIRSASEKIKVYYFFRFQLIAGRKYTIAGLPTMTNYNTTHSFTMRFGDVYTIPKTGRTSTSVSFTATKTEFVDVSISYAVYQSYTGGLSLTVKETEGSKVTHAAAAFDCTQWPGRILLPKEITYAQYKAWNRYLSVRQTLVTA